MILHSKRRDEGENEPVLVLVHTRVTKNGNLRAGLMFARAGLEEGAYELTSPTGRGGNWYIQLPEEAANLPRDGWAANVEMEVTNRGEKNEVTAGR